MKTLAIVLVIHGGGFAGGSAADDQPIIDQYRAAGIAARSVEYRLGSPWRALEDAKAAMRQEQRKGRRVFVIGFSAGGTLALRLAQTGAPEAVAVVAPLIETRRWNCPSYWPDVCATLTPWQRAYIQPAGRCSNVTSRTYVLHGTEDAHVPFAASQRYVAKRRCNAHLTARPGETHMHINVEQAVTWLARRVNEKP